MTWFVVALFGIQLGWFIVDLVDLRRCVLSWTLIDKTRKVLLANDRGVALDILAPHIRVDSLNETTKTVRELTAGAQAIADLFSLDSLQAVVAYRDGWMPRPKLVDPLRSTKLHLALGRVGMLFYPLLFGLLALDLGPRIAIMFALCSFCLAVASLIVAGTCMSYNLSSHRAFQEAIELYVTRMGGFDEPTQGVVAPTQEVG